MKTENEMKKYDILKDEYEKLWNYYNQGVQERFKLFDWYFKIVTIPSTVLAGFNFFSENSVKTNSYYNYIGLILLAIFLCGLCIYIIYAKQNSLTIKYDLSINKIREYYRTNYPELNEILIIDKLRSDKGFFNGLGSVKMWRGLILVFFNSIISSSCFVILFEIKKILWIILSYLIVVIFHIIVYQFFQNNYMHKKK
jgi:hypothetical protein